MLITNIINIIGKHQIDFNTSYYLIFVLFFVCFIQLSVVPSLFLNYYYWMFSTFNIVIIFVIFILVWVPSGKRLVNVWTTNHRHFTFLFCFQTMVWKSFCFSWFRFDALNFWCIILHLFCLYIIFQFAGRQHSYFKTEQEFCWTMHFFSTVYIIGSAKQLRVLPGLMY